MVSGSICSSYYCCSGCLVFALNAAAYRVSVGFGLDRIKLRNVMVGTFAHCTVTY